MRTHYTTESLAFHFDEFSNEILMSDGMQYEKKLPHHGKVTCYDHSVSVAWLSIRLAMYFHYEMDMKSLVRGALLHDYYLYDWHTRNDDHCFHGFHHAKRALRNAESDFSLSDIERDIIVKHMFPLNPQLPQYIESVIVTVADKVCAVREVFHYTGKKQVEGRKNATY
jgi:uncharacterized protein